MNKKAIKLAACVLLGSFAIPAVLGLMFSGASDVESALQLILLIIGVIAAMVALTLYAKVWIICDEIHEYLESKKDEEED